MAESSINQTEPEADIKGLKETLQAQQLLLQKLYTELDEERESSATAASEALSMILRLQGQKAVVEMEASQYKRMAEEKMFHAEESLEVFEDLMYQKEMEIAALEFQVQAYRCKLLSMGCSDLGVGETKSSENLLFQRNEAYNGDMGAHGIVRINNSLPPIQLKGSYPKRGVLDRERSPSPLVNMIPRIVEESMDKEFNVHCMNMEKSIENVVVGNFDSYWEQIRKLDERVKEMSDCKDQGRGSNSGNLKGRSRSSSVSSQVSYDPKREYPQNLLETEAIATTSACSSSIQDIFEVPQTNHDRKSCGKRKKEQDEWILDGKDRLEKPDAFLQEAIKPQVDDETSYATKMLQCTKTENLRPKEGVNVACHVAHVLPSIVVSEAEIKQLTVRMERLEEERRIVRHEISDGREDGMKLLKEMHEQLNSIQFEIRNLRTRKSPPQEDPSLLPLMEAMLYFWL